MKVYATIFNLIKKLQHSESSTIDVTKPKSSKKPIVELAVVIFLIATNFIIGSYLRSGLDDVLWNGDDATTIIIANSFQEKGNFNVNYLDDSIYYASPTDVMFKKYPAISHEEGGKGPIFYVLLGSFFKIFNATPKNFYFYASIFDNLLTSTFLVLFFFFIRKKFNLEVAFMSSLLVLITPYFAWYSARVTNMQLLYVFSITALFFLEKKKLHYFIFGIMVGLAHLTHPFGIFLGMTYSVYLLLHKEFKGFLITVLAWQLVLIPWFIRNYYLFHDIGIGLYIPLSDKISQLFSFIPHKEYLVSNISYFQPEQLPTAVKNFVLFDVLNGMLRNFSNLYHMDYLLIFLTVFTGFVFFRTVKFRIDKLRENLHYIIITTLAVILSFILISSYGNNVYLQIFFIFIIPPILIFLLIKLKKTIFTNPIPRIYIFAILGLFLNLIGYYYTALLLNSPIPETRQLMFSLFLVIPLGILSLEHFIQKINLKKKMMQKIVTMILFALILSPIMIQMTYGIKSINEFPFIRENNSIQNVNNWIYNNITKDQNIASNIPVETSFRTGIKSIALPSFMYQAPFEAIVTHYDISYLVFYDQYGSGPENPMYTTIMHWPILTYFYSDQYSSGNSHIIKVIYFWKQPSLVQHVVDSLRSEILLSTKLGQYDDALRTYDSLLGLYENKDQQKSQSVQTILSQKSLMDILYAKAQLLENLQRYDDANNVYLEIIRLDMFDKYAHEKRAMILEKLGMTSEAAQELEFVKRLELRDSGTK